jgi:hypothetical protein
MAAAAQNKKINIRSSSLTLDGCKNDERNLPDSAEQAASGQRP